MRGDPSRAAPDPRGAQGLAIGVILGSPPSVQAYRTIAGLAGLCAATLVSIMFLMLKYVTEPTVYIGWDPMLAISIFAVFDSDGYTEALTARKLQSSLLEMEAESAQPFAITLFSVYMLLYLLLLGLDLALVRRSLQAIGEIRGATAPGPVLAQRMRCASPGVPATSDSSSS